MTISFTDFSPSTSSPSVGSNKSLEKALVKACSKSSYSSAKASGSVSSSGSPSSFLGVGLVSSTFSSFFLLRPKALAPTTSVLPEGTLSFSFLSSLVSDLGSDTGVSVFVSVALGEDLVSSFLAAVLYLFKLFIISIEIPLSAKFLSKL